MSDLAVAFIVFNRPEVTRLSFARIREAKPSRLFLISDAARVDRPGESELVNECRRIVQDIDWDCETHRHYADQNMGCALRISSGITAAFEKVERLVVIEDDCVADPSFFDYCGALLERYHDNQRILAISGSEFQGGRRRCPESYYFSRYPHCWGWATWRRSWQHFDLGLESWPAFRDAGGMRQVFPRPSYADLRAATYWTRIFDRCHAGQIDSWAYPWTLSCWLRQGLTAIPVRNLVSNVGYGPEATHTNRQIHGLGQPAVDLGPIRHPNRLIRNAAADSFTESMVFSGTRGINLRRLPHSFRKRWSRWIGRSAA